MLLADDPLVPKGHSGLFASLVCWNDKQKLRWNNIRM